MKNTKTIGILGITVGAAAVLYSCYVHYNLRQVYKLIDRSVDEVTKDVSIDISDVIVKEAVNKAVEREVGRAIRDISYDVATSTKKDIQKGVKSSIDDCYPSIRTSVSDEISRQVANLDINKLKQEVRDKAKQMVIDKFDANLNALLDDFNQNLLNVSKIYGSIADSLAKEKERGPVFKMI